jgi:DNA-binding NtrC family response regulator
VALLRRSSLRCRGPEGRIAHFLQKAPPNGVARGWTGRFFRSTVSISSASAASPAAAKGARGAKAKGKGGFAAAQALAKQKALEKKAKKYKLPLRLREINHWPSLAEYLSGQERQYVDMVLRACHGDKAQAAQVLGIDVSRIG